MQRHQAQTLASAGASPAAGTNLLLWKVNRTSGPGLGANECVPCGMWRKSTAFRHSYARSSKRAVRLISGIALDECRVPERYRTRVPFATPERKAARAVPFAG